MKRAMPRRQLTSHRLEAACWNLKEVRRQLCQWRSRQVAAVIDYCHSHYRFHFHCHYPYHCRYHCHCHYHAMWGGPRLHCR